jgi:hypothetical protein
VLDDLDGVLMDRTWVRRPGEGGGKSQTRRLMGTDRFSKAGFEVMRLGDLDSPSPLARA